MAKRDYKNWDKNDLIKEIERLRKRKKYGLVWEDKPENVVEQCKTELPVLEEVKSKGIITDSDKPMNLLVEGDNYHALSVLNYTHKGKVDVIYIDPPYNTGNKDFVYNDQYVDKEDAYRHSKWLSFMYRRLKLAKTLLKNSGAIFISIDDNEFAQLKLLCDEIFGESNFINTIAMRVSPPNGVKTSHATKTIIKEKEYVVVYAKNKNKIKFFPQFRRADMWDSHFNKYIEKKGKDPNKWKVVSLSKKLNELDLVPDLNNPKFMKWINKEAENIFQPVGLSKIKNVDKYNTENIVPIDNSNYFAYKGRQVQFLSKSLKETVSGKTLARLLCDLWIDISFNNLFQEGGVEFKNGKKPISLIQRVINLVTDNKNATILDFFAGSGTTGEAVLELNKKDNGNRKFILCTYNEENGNGKIVDDYCYPRMKNAIHGYKNKKGLGGNLKYFKTAFVSADLTDTNKTKLTKKAAEMLCIKEDTFEKVKSTAKYKIFRNKKKYTGIIYDHLAIDDFKKEIAKIDGKFSVYIFSLGDDTFDEEFEDVKNKVKLSPIPEAILRVYRRIFK